jgi:acyl-CoA synthetase (AMP-forming)/AMP-acid ligase II
LKTNFGCAENVGGATFTDPGGSFPVEHLDPAPLFKERVAVAVPPGDNTIPVVGVGRPYPGMTIKILSRLGRELPEGHVGEIAFDTPSAMLGYMGNKRETSKALRGIHLLTGDQGYLRDGELFWMGRSRERINLHGKKYDPSDFEDALLGIDGLRPGCFAAFGVDDAKLGTQRLVIVSEVQEGHQSDTGKLIARVREEITKQVGANVSDVVLLARGSMSKTSSGKRRHRFYRNLYQEGALSALDSLLGGPRGHHARA